MIYCAFDVGNVLVHSDFNPFLKQLSKSLNLTLEEANYFMNRTQQLHDLGCTHMADELRDHFKIKSPVIIEELISQWNEVVTSADYMLEALLDLKEEHNLKIALLSNVGLEHAERMAKVLNQDGFFEEAVKHFSCQVGARKPTHLYYQSFLQLHPKWHGCVYVDDLQANLDASKQFGFKPYRLSLEDIRKADDPSEEFSKKMADLEMFILDSNPPQKNPRWH
jgi:FMN phosphatase YigB (HAD superfamily)